MNAPSQTTPSEVDWLRIVADRVQHLRFGFVQIVVHEGKVTQIESTERTRISPPGSNAFRHGA